MIAVEMHGVRNASTMERLLLAASEEGGLNILRKKIL